MLDRAMGRRDALTALILPLADRSLVLPNVAVAELIDYQPGAAVADAAPWHLGLIGWRNLQVPLLSFEAASGGTVVVGARAHIVVLNALSDDAQQRFIALLIQGIPRSCKVDNQLSYVDVPLAPLELAAVQIDEWVGRIPDLMGLEALVDPRHPPAT